MAGFTTPGVDSRSGPYAARTLSGQTVCRMIEKIADKATIRRICVPGLRVLTLAFPFSCGFCFRDSVLGHQLSHNYAAFLGLLQAFFLACEGV